MQEEQEDRPLTLEEAIEIADDFQDLVDTEITPFENKTYLVESVIVCPFDNDNLIAFIKNYDKAGDNSDLLASYNSTEYDVVLIAYELSEMRDFFCLDIRSFAKARGITYRFPE